MKFLPLNRFWYAQKLFNKSFSCRVREREWNEGERVTGVGRGDRRVWDQTHQPDYSSLYSCGLVSWVVLNFILSIIDLGSGVPYIILFNYFYFKKKFSLIDFLELWELVWMNLKICNIILIYYMNYNNLFKKVFINFFLKV